MSIFSCFYKSWTYMLITLSSWSILAVECDLLSGPRNSVSREGDTVQLNCSSSLTTTIKWTLTRPGSTDDIRTIFEPTSDKKGGILPSFVERFSVVQEKGGFQNLIIRNISLTDAGSYKCIDDDGFGLSNGQWAAADLVVSGYQLNCTDYIDTNGTFAGDICDRGLQPDNITVTCSIRYRGNIPPTLSWSQNNNKDSLTQHVASKILHNNMVISTLVVPTTKHMNASRFICSAKITFPSSDSQDLNISWTSSAVKLLYVNESSTRSVKEEMCLPINKQCHLDTNLDCHYEWSHLTAEYIIKQRTLSLSEVTQYPGIHQCQAVCHVRGSTCHINVSVVDVKTCSKVLQNDEKAADVSWWVYFIGFGVLFIVVFVVVIFRRRVFSPLYNCSNYRPPGTNAGEASCLDNVDNKAELADNVFKLSCIIPGRDAVYGITILKGVLYVIRGSAAIGVEVYKFNSNSYRYEMTYNIPYARQLKAIVACPWIDRLYITDIQQSVLHQYHPTVKKVTTRELDEKCQGLSVTSNKTLLVTLQSARAIKEYNDDWVCLRTINLDESFKNLQHCVHLDREQYVVCHQGTSERTRVCIVDAQGVILKKFDEKADILKEPRRIAVVDKQVVISDCGNKRVVLLDENLMLVTNIKIQGYDLHGPYALHWDYESRRLFIGECHSPTNLFICTMDKSIYL